MNWEMGRVLLDLRGFRGCYAFHLGNHLPGMRLLFSNIARASLQTLHRN